jgi:hypothetical protein
LPGYDRALPQLPPFLGVPQPFDHTAVWVLAHNTHNEWVENKWSFQGLFDCNAYAHRFAEDEAARWGDPYVSILIQTPSESYPHWHVNIRYFFARHSYEPDGRLVSSVSWGDDHRPNYDFPRTA